jgi:hypothetical protein
MANLHHLTPRHHEIMRRLMLGHSQRDIALDLGMNESYLSILVRSPLFQQEYRKLKDQELSAMMELRKTVLDGGNAGAKLIKGIVEASPETIMNLGEGIIDPRIRLAAANALVGHATRMTRINSISVNEGDGSATYERVLEETTTRRITERGDVAPSNGASLASPLKVEEFDLDELMRQEEAEYRQALASGELDA